MRTSKTKIYLKLVVRVRQIYSNKHSNSKVSKIYAHLSHRVQDKKEKEKQQQESLPFTNTPPVSLLRAYYMTTF